MRLRSFVGLLLAVAAVFAGSYLTHHNRDLLHERFRLGPTASLPLWGALLAVFLVGFLPAGLTLVVDTLRRELAARRDRRRTREQEALEATFRRALDFAADGQQARAAVELEAYLAARPGDFEGLLRYGEVLRGLGRLDEAVEVHRRAATLYPRSVGILHQLAQDHVEKGETDVAREIHGRIVREFPGFGLEVLRRQRAAAVARRDWAEAGKLHERIAQFLNEAGDAAALARESSLAQGLEYQGGVLLLEQDRAEEAAQIFRRLLAGEPRFLPARIMLGEAELLAGREPEAVAAWRVGYLETGSPAFLHRIEDHFIEQEEPVQAIETLRGSDRRGGQRPAAALLPGPALLSAGDARRSGQDADLDRRADPVLAHVPLPARPHPRAQGRPGPGGGRLPHLPAPARARHRRVRLSRLPRALSRLARLLLALRLLELGGARFRGGAPLGGGARRSRGAGVGRGGRLG